jgi:hypothetical protein
VIPAGREERRVIEGSSREDSRKKRAIEGKEEEEGGCCSRSSVDRPVLYSMLLHSFGSAGFPYCIITAMIL